VIAASILVLGVGHLIERKTVEALIPSYRATMGLLDTTFEIEDARVVEFGPNETLRFRANLARPITVEGHTLYPFGWNGGPAGGFQVTNTVGGVLAYAALVLVFVLAWPAKRFKELALRGLLVIPLLAVLLLIDAPITTTAAFWNSLGELLPTHGTSAGIVWSRFMMGGGGFVIALVMAISAIAGGRSLSAPRARWKTVSLTEFDAFVRKYPRPVQVDPPWDRPARRRYVRELLPDSRFGPTVAHCRRAGQSTRYLV
jgi:hypothetical protein